MLTIFADVPVTRRQILHHVLNEQDEPRWSGKSVVALFTWLYENGETEVRLSCLNLTFKLTIELIPD
jgi:hypothetical protein